MFKILVLGVQYLKDNTYPELFAKALNKIIDNCRYNQVLFRLSGQYTYMHYVEVYNDFVNKPDYYLDATHMNEKGYNIIIQKILSLDQQSKENKGIL